MAVLRPELPHMSFTMVPNAWLRDPNLPQGPKCLLMYYLSHDAGYRCSTSQAARELGIGRDTVSKQNAKLVELGYLVEIEQTRSAGGRWGENDYRIADCTWAVPPLPRVMQENPAQSPHEVPSDTVPVLTGTVEPCTVNPPYRRSLGEDHQEKTPLSAIPSPDAFDEFWAAYPRKVSKDAARRAWRSATRKASAQQIIDAVGTYPFRDDLTFVPHPATWLNNSRWEDDLSAVNPARPARINGSTPYRDRPAHAYESGF